jgi:hypothetical protein
MGIISQSDINEYWSTDPVTSHWKNLKPYMPVYHISQVYQDCRHEKINCLATESFLRLMKCFDGACRQNCNEISYVQNRRGIPQTLKDYQLRNRGDIFVMNNGPLESYKYLDSKPVYMLSTKHGSSLIYHHDF